MNKDKLIKRLEEALVRIRDEPQAAMRHYKVIARRALTLHYQEVNRNAIAEDHEGKS
jgi:hypothetical protein